MKPTSRRPRHLSEGAIPHGVVAFSCSCLQSAVDQREKFGDVNRFDGSVRGNAQMLTTGTTEDDVAATVMQPLVSTCKNSSHNHAKNFCRIVREKARFFAHSRRLRRRKTLAGFVVSTFASRHSMPSAVAIPWISSIRQSRGFCRILCSRLSCRDIVLSAACDITYATTCQRPAASHSPPFLPLAAARRDSPPTAASCCLFPQDIPRGCTQRARHFVPHGQAAFQ